MSSDLLEHLGIHRPDHLNVQKEYEDIKKIIKNGLHYDMDHGKCVLTVRWTKTAHDLYIHTADWLGKNPHPVGLNLQAARVIRVINKSRLEQIVMRATSPFRMEKYKLCMELLQTTLAEELVAAHHLTTQIETDIKNHCNQMDAAKEKED